MRNQNSWTSNNDYLNLSIKTGSARNLVLQKHGGTQVLVILTIKKMSYLVVGLLHDLVGPLLYIYL